MAIYRYDEPTAPFVGTIADIIQRGGQLRGEAAIEAAKIQAQAQMLKGQNWGNAIAQIGQLPGQVLDERRRDQLAVSDTAYKAAQAARYTQQAQSAAADDAKTRAAEAALAAAIRANPDNDEAVRDAVEPQFPGVGIAWYQKSQTVKDHVAAARQAQQGYQNSVTGIIGNLAKSATDEGDFFGHVQSFAQRGLIGADQVGQIWKDLEDPTVDWKTRQKQYLDRADAVTKPVQLTHDLVAPVSGTTVAAAPVGPPKTQAQMAYAATDVALTPQQRAAAALDRMQKGAVKSRPMNVMLNGKEVPVSYVPGINNERGAFLTVDPTDPTKTIDVTGQVQSVPNRSLVAAAAKANADKAWTPDLIDYYARQVMGDAGKLSVIGGIEKGAKQQVLQRIAQLGGDINKISETSRAQAEMAREILPKIPDIAQMAKQLNDAGLMGPIGGRWREFLGKKVGSIGWDTADYTDTKLTPAEIVAAAGKGDDPNLKQLVGRFQSEVGLFATALARAHGGARGGGSPMMLKHIEDIFGPNKSDYDSFIGQLSGAQTWMQGYADLVPTRQPGGGTPTPNVPRDGGKPFDAKEAQERYHF